MTTILDRIFAYKKVEIERRMREEPLEVIKQRVSSMAPVLSFSDCLSGPGIHLIAEVKKASPSRGILVSDFDPVSLASTYVQGGASAISVLTEVDHFQGNLEHLLQVSQAVHTKGIPVLRKDFLFDPYQLYESRAYGADAVLLIVSLLDSKQLEQMLALAQSLQLQCLTEVHSEKELSIALEVGAHLIGINHRNLHTFETDISLTQRLLPMIPAGKLIVSESGIKNRTDVVQLEQAGTNAILVGETLVTATDIRRTIRNLLGETEG